MTRDLLIALAIVLAGVGLIAWIAWMAGPRTDEQSAEVLEQIGVRPVRPRPAAARDLQPDHRDLELWDLIDHENHRDNDSTGEDYS
ncbi:hypothetical protein ACFQZ4_23990 [Catellatospora coxensis]|uniref:Uncharacterized protein n=1 Tax=Catellatospora coxensis TaxID=310354 RepID=A0A8J3L8Z0_9ACTN|nr:hypothetical protein [Catellatospora coxensis]GIG10180.1 hypothetical protein Cco03nite_68800 [Catellatospora coxensis]